MCLCVCVDLVVMFGDEFVCYFELMICVIDGVLYLGDVWEGVFGVVLGFGDCFV